MLVYIEITMKVRDFLPKISLQKQLRGFYFVTSRQYWLGIAKHKNVFKSTINPSTRLIYVIFKKSYLA